MAGTIAQALRHRCYSLPCLQEGQDVHHRGLAAFPLQWAAGVSMSTTVITENLFLSLCENDRCLRLGSLLSENIHRHASRIPHMHSTVPHDPLTVVIHLLTACLLPQEHGLSA